MFELLYPGIFDKTKNQLEITFYEEESRNAFRNDRILEAPSVSSGYYFIHFIDNVCISFPNVSQHNKGVKQSSLSTGCTLFIREEGEKEILEEEKA